MIKTSMLVLLFFVFSLSAGFAQHAKPQKLVTSGTKTSTTGETRYFLRVFNCDDRCVASLNGKIIIGTGFGQDSGWIELTSKLLEGPNEIKFAVYNDGGGGIAYGFQLRRNETTLFEQICGHAGTMGCDNNRVFPISGVAREFRYELRVSAAETAFLKAQKTRTSAAASQAWPQFWSAFRAAVNNRDREALKKMMSSPYNCDGSCTPAEVVRNLDQGQGWREFQKTVALGTKANGLNGNGRLERITTHGMLYFEFGADGRWRWAGEYIGD